MSDGQNHQHHQQHQQHQQQPQHPQHPQPSHTPNAPYQHQQMPATPYLQQSPTPQQHIHPPMPGLYQSNIPSGANNANAQAVMTLMQNHTGGIPQPNANPFAFMQASTLAAMGKDDPKRFYDIVDITKLTKSFKEAFNRADRAKMLADFEVCESMTLLNDLDTMYTIYINQCSFNKNKQYLFYIISGFYKKNYGEMYEKYPSLNTFVDFCIAMLVFRSMRDLKNACKSASSTCNNTLSNPEAGLVVSRLIRTRKPYRGENPELKKARDQTTLDATLQQASNPNEQSAATSTENTANADSAPMYDTLEKKLAEHPVLKTEIVKTNEDLFNIGRCFKYCIPSEFIPLFARLDLGQATRLGSNTERSTRSALVCTLSRPFFGHLWSRTVKQGQYMHFSQMENLAEIVTAMTGLTNSNTSFDYGKTKDLSVQNVTNGNVMSNEMSFGTKGCHNIAIIDRINIFGVANKSFTTKSFSKNAYIMNEQETSTYDINAMKLETDRTLDKFNNDMDIYEFKTNITEEDMATPLKWAIKDPVVVPNEPNANDNNNHIRYDEYDEPIEKKPRLHY